jgi:hypothetical protein
MEPFIYKYQVMASNGYRWEQKRFANQKDLFNYLVENKDMILEQRKSTIKNAEGSLSICFPSSEENEFTSKSIKPIYSNDKENGILKRTIVANTYWWMDSHSDVHIGKGDAGEEGSGIFSQSIKRNPGKIPPIDQHNYSLDGRIGRTLKLYEAPISWRALGVGRTGMTEALFAEAQIEKSMNEKRYNDYLQDEIDQHSVGMRYIDIELAVNDAEEFPKEHTVWKKYIAKIGNRQDVEKQGFFFAVSKGDLREYSAVIAGSNELTPTIIPNSGDTDKESLAGANDDDKILEAIDDLLLIKFLNL